MGKDHELLQAVKDQDIHGLHKILQKNKAAKNKLISSGKRLNVNHQDCDGMSAVHQAALVGNVDIMKLLLESGASVDMKDSKGMRPLHYAAWQGKHEPVSILLQWGSSANEPALDGETPMHLACQHGHHDVVNSLLIHHGDPTVLNKDHKTPLDLACEFGRASVVELLLSSNLCTRLLHDTQGDLTDNQRTTCLHLAAKNGHAEIIRLLLQAGVDINRQTLQGTCLHEAALYGKIETVRLLLDCGIDVNRPNSYEQTALDIVNKFTTSRAAKELKQLLKESSYAVSAQAVKSYCNPYEPNNLSFNEGDYITVLEQRADGLWKGYVMHEGHLAKTGYFPASAVMLIDSREVMGSQTHLTQLGDSLRHTKQAPGQVPDIISRNNAYSFSNNNNIQTHGNYSSVGMDESFPPPPSPLVVPKSPSRDSDRDSGISPQHTYPPQSYNGFQGVYGQQLSPTSPDHRTVEWLGHHAVDHGDYHSESPNRNSPNSSNRNSAASTGSGGYMPHHYVNVQITQQHRLSGQSYESGVSGVSASSSRQSYHSTSSSSLGSLDRLEESGYSSTINVHELFQTGLSQDSEVLRAWLADLHFEEYFNLFIQAGYDMPTISRMTPEDLTAIGITKPAHRKRLKAEISRLHIHDGIPVYKPNDVLEWLRLLNLEQYYDTLVSQGYSDINYVTDITWEDLEEIGIKMLGHQKKIILAIERLKRIQTGGHRLSAMERHASTEMLEPPSAYPTPRWLLENSPVIPPTPAPGPPAHFSQEVAITTGKPKKSSSGDNLAAAAVGGGAAELRTFQQQPLSRDDLALAGQGDVVYFNRHARQSQGMVYQPDLVPIQVHRNAAGRSMDNLDHPDSGQGQVYQSFYSATLQRGQVYRDEGSLSSDEMDGSSTLKRPSAMVSPRISPKPKPVAKIVAKTKRASRDVTPTADIIKVEDAGEPMPVAYSGTLTRKNTFHAEPIYDKPADMKESTPPPVSPKPLAGGNVDTLYTVPHRTKKPPPPPPPKRTNSIKGDNLTAHQEAKRVDPPVPPKPVVPPQDSQHGQPQAFTSCVKSLSDRFSKSSANGDSKIPGQTGQNVDIKAGLPPREDSTHSLPEAPLQDYTPPQNEDFPPPPPPISSEVTVESKSKKYASGYTDNPLSEVIEQLERTAASRGDTNRDQAKPVAGAEGGVEASPKRDSNTSVDSNTSGSSTDTLPFANENVGTIKQRQPAAKPSIVSVSGGEDGDDKCIDLNDEIFDDGSSTIKRNPKAGASAIGATGTQRTAQVHPLQRGESKKVPPPTPKRRDSINSGVDSSTSSSLPDSPIKKPGESGDVLNDIGNMLQDLTDELDAMLEFELQ